MYILSKFKTTNDEYFQTVKILPTVDRSAKIGKFLRMISFDELPQLIIVLKCDTSFIGRRTLVISYLPLYNMERAKLRIIKLGILGWAWVNCRNVISWE